MSNISLGSSDNSITINNTEASYTLANNQNVISVLPKNTSNLSLKTQANTIALGNSITAINVTRSGVGEKGECGEAGTEYTDGATTVAHPIGGIPVFDNAGTITAVSDTNPLPVLASVSTAGLATDTKQDAAATLTGAVNETAPASDTASSGLNGRLQRIAQRLTSLIALLPTSLGQKTKANSLAVTLASDQDALPVTGTFWQATQPVSGTVTANTGLTQPLTDTQLRATPVPVSGTVTATTGGLTDTQLRASAVPVTANAGTNLNTSALALDATLTGGTQQAKITDGTNVATVKAASTAALAADKAVVVAVSPNNTVPVSLATNTPTLQSGSTTAVTQATAANLNATVVGTGTFVTQSTLAAETTKVIGVTRSADGSGNLITSTSNALDVNIKTPATLPVSLASVPSHAVTNAGTFAVQATLTDTAVTGNITTQNLVPAGTATAGSALLSGDLNGMSAIAVQTTGTYTGALSAQVTVDNATWVTLGGTPFLNVNTGVYSATIPSAATAVYQLDVAGYRQVRITGLAAMTGTAVVSIRASNGVGMVALDAPIPTGSNVIGALTANQSTNIAQMNGVATTMGAGASGTGTQRVVTSTDSTIGTLTSITNNVNTVEVAPTTVLNGNTNVTTAGTRVVLASSTTCKSVTIKAKAANTGIIYVGSSTVSSANGFALLAGETVTLDIANLTTVNLDASVSGEGVTYLGIN